jgi:hypothetical protein
MYLPNDSVLENKDNFTVIAVVLNASNTGSDHIIEFAGNELSIGLSDDTARLTQSGNTPTSIDFMSVPQNTASLMVFRQATSAGTTTAQAFRDALASQISTFSSSSSVFTDDVRTLFGDVSGDEWDGQLAEILVFDRALTDNERMQLENYLAGKWNVYLNRINPFFFEMF